MTKKVNRSSVSGQFVNQQYANNHPRTTETQRISSGSKEQEVHRNSVNGRFVTQTDADKHPKTTEKEHI